MNSAGPKVNKKKEFWYPYGKVFESEKGVQLPIWKRVINLSYSFYAVFTNYTKWFLWTGSCAFFMFLAPMGAEILFEQNRILQKIQ